MPQNAFFPWTRHLLVSKTITQRHFFSTLHPLSSVIFATATVVAFVLLRNSWLNFHCYTQHEATPTQKSAWKWRCDLSWLLAWKITKGIYSCKPASLNCPTGWEDCMCDCLLLPDHMGSHTLSSEDLSPFVEGWMLLCTYKELFTVENSPPIITTY